MSTPAQSIQASQRVHDLLHRLHAESEAQEKSIGQSIWYVKRVLAHYLFGQAWSASSDVQMLDKFVALEEDKCQFTYLLARSIGARNIVEAGTSFGVSTIYLALAVAQNTAPGQTGKVIATEKEPVKAERARRHWKEAGDEIEPWIDLRVGDLRETLKVEEGMPEEIDMLLLDSKFNPFHVGHLNHLDVLADLIIVWTPMALPALEVIKPRLRKGAIILADNTLWARSMYKDLFNYLHEPSNGFKTMTTPFRGGFEVAVYLPN